MGKYAITYTSEDAGLGNIASSGKAFSDFVFIGVFTYFHNSP